MTVQYTDNCNRSASAGSLGTSSDGKSYTLVQNASYLSVDGSRINASFSAGIGPARFAVASLSVKAQHFEGDFAIFKLPARRHDSDKSCFGRSTRASSENSTDAQRGSSTRPGSCE